MEIDRDEAPPIWALPVEKKKSQNNNELRNRHTTSKKEILKEKKKKEKDNQEDEENGDSNSKLVKYVPKNSSSGRNKCEDEDKITECTHDSFMESESDYDEDSISTENQMSFEYQHPNNLVRPINPYYSSENEYYRKPSKSKILKDSNFPQLLTSYSKFLFNALLLVVAVWILFYFIITIKKDINIKYNEHLMENMKNISDCYEKFEINKCSSDIKIPALEDTCKDWEACLNQNPDDIKVIMIGAEVVSEILNKFVDPLSIKTTIVIIVLCVIFFIIIWKMNSIPSNKQKEGSSTKEHTRNNRINNNEENLRPIGMCPPQAMDSRFIGNGLIYQVAPAAVYPGEAPYSIPIAYPPIYPYPGYPIYQEDLDSSYSPRSRSKYRKASRHQHSPPPHNQQAPKKSNKGYKFVRSGYNNRNPYYSRFSVHNIHYPPPPPPPHYRSNVKGKYYYDNEDEDSYEMVDDYDENTYYDDEYEY
jgi:hypothetical protein